MDVLLSEHFENMPAHVLHLPDMTITSRDTMKQHIRRSVKAELKIILLSHPNGIKIVKQDVRRIINEKSRYAIFSHRWGVQEPTFQEMNQYSSVMGKKALLSAVSAGGGMIDQGIHFTASTLTAKDSEIRAMADKVGSKFQEFTGPGFSKLDHFCSIARNVYGCDWAWSDTCCINKSDLSELDESIRSMFRWYRGATVCIVHLGGTRLSDFQSDLSEFKFLAKDAWFSRGWTLQELLAPKMVKFYDRDWTSLSGWAYGQRDDVKSDKELFLEELASITKIPVLDLLDYTPGVDRVRERMSWAAKRRTSRVEDRAYSLFGVFGVSFTVAYGSQHEAFLQLQKEIMIRTDDPSIFSWWGAPSPSISAFAHKPDGFGIYEGDESDSEDEEESDNEGGGGGENVKSNIKVDVGAAEEGVDGDIMEDEIKKLNSALTPKSIRCVPEIAFPRGFVALGMPDKRGVIMKVPLYTISGFEALKSPTGAEDWWRLKVDGLGELDVHIVKYQLKKLSTLRVAIVDYEQGDYNPDDASNGMHDHISRFFERQQAIEEYDQAHLDDLVKKLKDAKKQMEEDRKKRAEQRQQEEKEEKEDVKQAAIGLTGIAVGSLSSPWGAPLVVTGAAAVTKALVSTAARHAGQKESANAVGNSNDTVNTIRSYRDLLQGRRQRILQSGHDALAKVLLQTRMERRYSAMILKTSFTSDATFGRLRAKAPVNVNRPTHGWKVPEEVYVKDCFDNSNDDD
ncbi:hypothetical protein BDZ94DRAFT_1244395 [Collybia nuda]|uniref:Heterokaryon incompatibility domain-containing protein n=1 Tax=Collybia nuda TaxID=64659 RepID=A0A9P5YKT6_9AGAR|nr:hypothetical protein BDZ94DRAFT_1244395 [Collybia nuda]